MRSLAELEKIEPPNSQDAETSVLGAVLIDPAAMEEASILKPKAFFSSPHRIIYESMLELFEAGESIDIVTLTSRLEDHGQLETIGGVSYLARVAHSVPTAANIDQYVVILQDKYLLRQLIDAARKQFIDAVESGDVQQVIASMQVVAAKLSDQAAPAQEFKPIREVMMDVYDGIEQRFANKDNGNVTGIATGFDDLDNMTAGFQDGELIIVAARPSVGKTAFALNIAKNVAVKTKETVALFSLEMSDRQLGDRMVSAEGNLDASKIKTGKYEDGDWEKTAIAVGILGETNIFIDDSPVLNVQEIRNKCRRLKKKHGLGLIVIDYLQLIAGSGKRGENRQQEVSEISRTLKQIARELEVPVVALSQLSRGVEQRQDKRPMMSDLRESGSIEQDADIVAFLYRDDYYNADTEKKNIIEIIIAKQRNGPVGTVELVFLKNFNKFVNYERSHDEQSYKQPKNDDKRKWAN
ncbi:replicative DNA helicase [Paenibacillus sp. IHBB 10380]|uniref:replicative DNA helicase n=1 Tax=Paenibacillus sp. IHBB 10380 TaxID=1566358 RepID=UPI0005CFBB8C|nr:replicative DNA helicase [Paenibacillus sp. IHBB 10380]AJS59876.1 DNA helicase [Paenibacillus sp. IHBB 10380]